MIQQEIFYHKGYINCGSVAGGGTKTGTATVPSCPDGYSYSVTINRSPWGTVVDTTLSGTTLSIQGLNPTTGTQTIEFNFTIIYYKNDLIK